MLVDGAKLYGNVDGEPEAEPTAEIVALEVEAPADSDHDVVPLLTTVATEVDCDALGEAPDDAVAALED